MSVGRMRHRLQLQSKTVTADGGGSDGLTSYGRLLQLFMALL